jgi:ABC-type glycerol-3-phosphate transport system substrate-binding protein
MKWMTKGSVFTLTLALTGSLLAGCSQSAKEPEPAAGGEKAKPQEKFEPVTLKMYQTQGYWTDEDFKKLILEPVQKKYPHISIEFMSKSSVEKAITAGEDIDLISVWNGLMPQYDDMGLFEDITPLAKKMNMDLGRFDPGSLEGVKMATKNVLLYGLPNWVQIYVLYYNKDIFDRFGVPYPKDGMTWDETIDLAKKVTRQDGGVQYLGLDPDYLTRMLTPLSLGIVDGRTDKTDVNSEPYKQVFETGKRIYDIPGNKPKEGIMKGSVTDRFVKDKNLAMLTTINLFDKLTADPNLNWDVAQYPSYPNKPNLYGAYDINITAIAKISKHKEDAMRVLEVVFSDEVQLMSARAGKLPLMKDPKFQNEFLKGNDAFKDKKISSIFKSKPAPAAPPYSNFYTKSRGMLVDKFKEYAEGKKDVNTVLREAEEAINQYIKSEKP